MYAAYPMITEWCKMKGIHIVFWTLDDYIPSELVTRAPNGKGWCNWIAENGLTIGDECGNMMTILDSKEWIICMKNLYL